jgi:hypothetical protein
MAADLARQNIPAYIEPSHRGGHVWLFTPSLSGADARGLGKFLLQRYRINEVELFPKQKELITGPGSLVRLPFGIHRKTNHRYHFIHLDGSPLAPSVREQIALLNSPARMDQTHIRRLLEQSPELHPDRVLSPKTKRRLSTLLPSEKIKSIPIEEFIRVYDVELDQAGRGYCPFHDDQRKSFAIYPDTNTWHCFAGCKGATNIDFVLRWRELHGQSTTWNDVLRETLEFLGIPYSQ